MNPTPIRAIPTQAGQPTTAETPRSTRHPYLLIAALGALVAFSLGQLSSEAIDLPHSSARSLLITVCAVACLVMTSLWLAIHMSRQHTQTRAEVRQLRDELLAQAREAAYAIGYVDGVQRKPPREGGPTLRPVV